MSDKNSFFSSISIVLKICHPNADFKGLDKKQFDGRGNYSLGIKEQIVFPEIDYNKVDKIRGLDVTIVTTSKNKEGTLELLKEFNFPLNEKKN